MDRNFSIKIISLISIFLMSFLVLGSVNAALSFDAKVLQFGQPELLYYINNAKVVDAEIWYMGEFLEYLPGENIDGKVVHATPYEGYNVQNISIIAQGDNEGVRDTLYYIWPESEFGDLRGNQEKLSQTSMSPLVKTILDQTGRLAFYYREGGEIKKNKKEIKDFLFSSTSISNKFGAYFALLVSTDDIVGKNNPELVNKYVVLVVDKDRLSDDDIYYYIINDYDVDKEAEYVESTSSVENISESYKHNFCADKEMYYKLPNINLSYNPEDIDCSVYSINGHFCDAEQLAKYIEKNGFEELELEKISNIIRGLEDLEFKFGTKSEKYLAKDKIPLALTLSTIHPDFDINLFKDNIFVVMNGACPSSFYKQGHYLQNIDKCYIPYNNTIYLDLKDSKYHFEYLIKYAQNTENLTDNHDLFALYDYDGVFNILLALGENPRNYGIDLVYLKPDTYTKKAGIFDSSDKVLDTNFIKMDNLKGILSLDGILAYPDVYFIKITKYTSEVVEGALKRIGKYSIFNNEEFWVGMNGQNNALLNLALNPSYGINKDLANVSVSVFKEKPSLFFTVSSNPKYIFEFENDSGKINISHDEGKFNFNLPRDTPKDTFYLESMLPGLNKRDIYCYKYLDNGSIEGQKFDNKELSEYADAEIAAEKQSASSDTSTAKEGETA